MENTIVGEDLRDEKYIRRSSVEQEMELDKSLDLKPISIRLQNSLIEKLKFIARFHGIGYQPLIRDLLNRFVSHEFVNIAKQLQDQEEAEQALSDEDSPAAKYMREFA